MPVEFLRARRARMGRRSRSFHLGYRPMDCVEEERAARISLVPEERDSK